MDDTTKLLLLAGVGYLAYKYSKAQAAPTSSSTSNPYISTNGPVVIGVPGATDPALRGSFLNGVGENAIVAANLARQNQVRDYFKTHADIRTVTPNPALPVKMRANSPVNMNWSADVKTTNKPIMTWQDKELAYLKANPNSSGPWIHNADGTVSRGFPKEIPGSYPQHGLTPAGTTGGPNAPVYSEGSYQGTVDQVKNAILQNLNARVFSPAQIAAEMVGAYGQNPGYVEASRAALTEYRRLNPTGM